MAWAPNANPSGVKTPQLPTLFGTTEVVPFHETICETSLVCNVEGDVLIMSHIACSTGTRDLNDVGAGRRGDLTEAAATGGHKRCYGEDQDQGHGENVGVTPTPPPEDQSKAQAQGQ